MKINEIELTKRYWCVLKISVVDENEKEKPEFMIHILRGYATAVGFRQLKNDDKKTPFVEMAGQRLKLDRIFKDRRDAIECMSSMVAEMQMGLKA